MFHFLQKPQFSENTVKPDINNVSISTSEIPQWEDVGQIAVDVLETVEWYIIIAPLAWVPRSDVDVTISRNVLTITGCRPEPEIYDQAIKIPVQECYYWPFSRSIILPENLALDIIRASIERGMLIITIPFLIVDARTVKVEHIEDMDD